MSRTQNARAITFARRFLFRVVPTDGHGPSASLSVADLAYAFCGNDECDAIRRSADGVPGRACSMHVRAMVRGVAKMIASGELHAELSARGVLYVRLSPEGVLAPLEWKSQPDWFDERPDLLEWARVKTRGAVSLSAAANTWGEVV